MYWRPEDQELGWEDEIKIPGRRIRRKRLKDLEDSQEDQRQNRIRLEDRERQWLSK